LDKTYFIQFTNKSKCSSDIKVKYERKQITLANETKFLRLHINSNNISWKTHIEYIRAKLSSACYAMLSVKPYVNTSKMIYYSYFHSIMTYGLLFWGHSLDSITIFRLQKKIIRIMVGHRHRDSCRELFFKLEILPLPSQYILPLLLFMMRNKNQCLTNSEIYHINTRQQANLQLPSVNVAKYQKAVYYLVINALLCYIKTKFDNPMKFKRVLQKFLYENYFYSLNE
jgi:hypothetical protein